MGRSPLIGSLVLPWVLALGGCLGHPGGPDGANQVLAPEILPAGAREPTDPEARVPMTPPYSPELGRPVTTDNPYRTLSAPDCRCLAVRAAGLAKVLDAKRDALAEQAAPHRCLGQGRQEAAGVQQGVLFYAALDDRNRAAGAALESFYRLAEAEAQADLLNASLDQAEATTAQARKLQAQGVRTRVDVKSLRRQSLDLQSQGAQLAATVAELNVRLRQQLGFDPGRADWQFWPRVEAGGEGDPPDLAAAVDRALHTRPDLLMLRYLLDHLDAGSLPAARQALALGSPLLGMAPPSSCLAKLALFLGCSGGKSTRDELASTRHQLEQALAERERQAVAEVHLAFHQAQAGRSRAVLAREQVNSWEETLRELEDRMKQGAASFAEVSSARLERNRARGELVKALTAWKTALVQLAQAQGLLAEECPAPVSPDSAPAGVRCRLGDELLPADDGDDVTGAGKKSCSTGP